METITVNGVTIDTPAIFAEMQNHPATKAEAAMHAAAEALVVRELLWQEACRQGFDEAVPEGDETPQEQAIRRLIEREIETPEADEATCRRYYDNNRKRFRSPDAFDAQHILYAAAPDDEAARAAARAKAKDALARVLADPGAFEQIARAESACTSRDQGGRLGTIQRGDADPVFETYLMSLSDGEICPMAVETRYGFHVIRLLRSARGRELPFDAVRQRIAGYLEDAAWRRGVHQYVAILAGRARIDGIALEAATSPLVQ